MNLDRSDLLSFLQGLQDGSVTFQVKQKEYSDISAIAKTDTDKEVIADDKTQEIE